MRDGHLQLLAINKSSIKEDLSRDIGPEVAEVGIINLKDAMY